jgi:DNA-binding PadR family transcriptional regulator
MINDYSFTRPLATNGKPTRYISVLSFLDKSGPTHRHEILKNIWHVTNKDYHEFYRGHMSTLFASMRRNGIIEYNSKTYKWFITSKGKQMLESAKKEWGKRYAEKYWC